MADYQFNTNLGPSAQQGTSLADLINTARGVQAFQQAEQINPLAAQKARMEVEQLQKLNPLQIQKATAEAKSADFGLAKSYAEKERGVLGGLANDPDFINGNKNAIVSKLKSAKSFLKAIGVPEHPEDTTDQILQIAEKDSKAVLPYIKNMIQGEIGATGQQALQTPQLGTVGSAPATFVPGTSTAAPLNIGGQTSQGFVPETKPQGVTSTQMQLSYPVRKAGDIRPFAPNEPIDTEKGAAYRNSLTARQTDLATARRNLDEVIKEAGNIKKEDLFSSGALGALTRTIKGGLGDPKYKQLSKDLANVQIANIQAQGGSMDTVAGQQLQRMANGDETFPPDVLINIARRTYADLTNLDMQATAASKFAQKYGDSNLNTFKRMWSSNADSKVFEAMSIFDNVKDPQKRKEEIDKLLGSNPQQRQEFFQKYNNIKKLTSTGEL
jgi:hypothetical protein